MEAKQDVHFAGEADNTMEEKQIPKWKIIAKNISYITPVRNPLSSNVVVVEGEKYLFIYDVGSHKNIPSMLLELSKEKEKEIYIILSHFHPDHITNLRKVEWAKIYQGKNTFKYTHIGDIVENEMCINDGDMDLVIFPMPSSHAKGSLAVMIDKKYCLLGDALYPSHKGDKTVYNVGILKQQIDLLKNISASYVMISHREPFLQKKQGVISWLENIYAMRVKNEPWIDAEI